MKSQHLHDQYRGESSVLFFRILDEDTDDPIPFSDLFTGCKLQIRTSLNPEAELIGNFSTEDETIITENEKITITLTAEFVQTLNNRTHYADIAFTLHSGKIKYLYARRIEVKNNVTVIHV